MFGLGESKGVGISENGSEENTKGEIMITTAVEPERGIETDVVCDADKDLAIDTIAFDGRVVRVRFVEAGK